MRYKQAMEILDRVAKDVDEITSVEHSGEGWQRILELKTANGRLTADAERGSSDNWFRHDGDSKNPSVDRVRITAGHCRTEGGSYGKKVTRTFMVRQDGTLNEAGIAKALKALAEIKEREVVYSKKRSDQESRDQKSKLAAYRLLGEAGVLAELGYMSEDRPIEQRVSSYGTVEIDDNTVSVSVASNGAVTLKLERLGAPQALEVLQRLGYNPESIR